MERIYAFTDESGDSNFNFNLNSTTQFFIVTSIVIPEKNLDEIKNQVEDVRKRFFQTGEMKSSKVGKNHKRRLKIISELNKIEYKLFSIVVDKRKIYDDNGLMYRKTFYKFINNLVHKELRKAFKVLTICADEIGSNDYIQSFIKYVKQKEEIPNFFNEREFYFQNSKNNVLIQLADFISGTLSYVFEEKKQEDNSPNYLEELKMKTIRIENWPKNMYKYRVSENAITSDYDSSIAELSLAQAQTFLNENDESDDEDIRLQVLVLKYLCFRFINNDTRDYITTTELINNLKYRTGEKVPVHYFRSKIIAKLRDAGVIIASSSKGYKIPSKEIELDDFIEHGTSVIVPMLERMKKCRDIVQLATLGELDLFKKEEYAYILEILKEIEVQKIQ